MLNILIRDILSNPAILIGIFVLLGNLLLKKSLADIISSTFQTIIGFTMLTLGAGIVSGTLDNFSQMFTKAFNLQAAIMNTDAYGALLSEHFKLTPIIMIFGMIFNIIIAKYSRFKHIFLSGNILLYMSGTLAMILDVFHPIITIILGAIILGTYMSLSPALLHKYTTQITGNNDFGVANAGSVNYYLAAKIGELIGDKEQTTEDINVPSTLNFLQEPAVSMSLTMSLLFIFVSFFTGVEFIEQNLSNGQNFLFFSFMQGIIFAAGVLVLLNGITMAIDELVPAFRGIANRVIDGALPALDAPVMVNYAPNAMILGFLISLLASLVGMVLLSFTSLPIIIPGMLQHFFVGGIAATYGNSTGGRKGAIVGSFINGLMMAFLPSIFLIFVDGGFSETVVIGDSDFTIIGILLKYITNFFR